MTALNNQRQNKGWANLIPVKPGEVRNPKGRPRTKDCLIECIKRTLREKLPNGLTNEEMIANMLVAMAQRGNIKAIELVLAYTTAKPTQAVDMTTKGEAITSFAFVLPDGTKVSPGALVRGSSNTG